MARKAKRPRQTFKAWRGCIAMPGSFHNYERKLQRGKTSLDKLGLSGKNKQAILDFTDFCFSEGLSVPRVEKYLWHLRCLAELFQMDFSDATRNDIERLVRTIEQMEYSDWSKRDFRITLKKFYRWLRNTDKDPPEVEWLRCVIRNNNHKLPEELLTEEDVSGLIDACYSSRDKAFISVLYESGCRIGEMASLRIKHVVPDTHGFRLIVSGKTGSRRLLVISSAVYLTQWLNEHPLKSDPHAPLWISNDYRNQPLGYSRIYAILETAAKRAGVKKKVNPHIFRHSRATHLAKFLTEAQMNAYFGWVQGSNMPSVYVHLSGRDVDQALLKTYGITPDKDETMGSRFKPRICQRCELQNAPTDRFCSRCGTALDEETASMLIKRELERKRVDGIMDRLINDREFRDLMDRKLRELGIIKP